jgi:hypothetical protein
MFATSTTIKAPFFSHMINVKEQKEREDLLNLDFYLSHTFTEWALYSLNESAKLYLTD